MGWISRPGSAPPIILNNTLSKTPQGACALVAQSVKPEVLILAQVMISGSWDPAYCQALLSARSQYLPLSLSHSLSISTLNSLTLPLLVDTLTLF